MLEKGYSRSEFIQFCTIAANAAGLNWPATAEGVGMTEAPRGALAHWVRIKDGAIDNYQLVVPSTWNASPRDSKGQRSAYEGALIDMPVANPEQPREILRIIPSFDPYLACAVPIYDPKGAHAYQVQFY
jgi:hydrogenase large subunit